MKKLTYNKRKKEYSGIAFASSQSWLSSEVIVVAPNLRLLKKFYKSIAGGLAELECDPKLCRWVKVIAADKG